jgi:trimethylamine-N-oxide reductase (cytochrome c)
MQNPQIKRHGTGNPGEKTMSDVSRRKFLFTTAAMAGGSLAAPAAGAHTLLTGTILDRKTHLTAAHWGICEATVVGGRLISMEPSALDRESPSPMLHAIPDRVYSQTRVQYPMVREGFLKNGSKSDTSGRGKEKFVRVSWDEALDLVASELQRVKKEHGNEAIHSGSSDWHSVGKLHSSPTLLRRMLALHGGYTDNAGDFSFAAATVILPHVIGGPEVYEPQSAWPTVIDNSELVILWGCNILKNNQVGFSPTDHSAYGYVRELKKKGTKVVSIDPRITDTAEFLDAEWMPVRPNTDAALMLALAHVLYTADLYDKNFIRKYTVGFDKFLPYLLGTSDGTPKDPEWAEKITSIPAASIRDLAQRMAKSRTMIMGGWSIQRQDHGEQPYWMLVTLAAMLGQIGLPGGGFGLSYHYANNGSLTANGVSIPGISSLENPVKTAVPIAQALSDMLLNPGKTVDYNGKQITYPDIKLIYWAGGNPFTHQMDRNRQIRAWQKPETIVVNEMYWSSTARFADIVLPATTTYERNDLEGVSEYSGRYLVAMPKLIDPLHEAKDDLEIFREISKRLGFEDKFTEGKDEMAWLRSFYEEARNQAGSKKIDMPDFETFWSRGYFEFPIPDNARNFVRHADFRNDPATNALGTPSGRIEIYSSTIEKFKYDDCPPHPAWLEPAEWLGSEKTEKFPFHVISPHPKFRLHSQMNNTWLREAYEVGGREPIWIHPDDAKKRGIKNGDVVRVFNDRGQLLAGAIVTNRIRPGVLMLEEGAWYDPDKPGEPGALCKHGNINVLTLDKGTSKLAQANIANTVLANIERYEGTPPPVTAFIPPATS